MREPAACRGGARPPRAAWAPQGERSAVRAGPVPRPATLTTTRRPRTAPRGRRSMARTAPPSPASPRACARRRWRPAGRGRRASVRQARPASCTTEGRRSRMERGAQRCSAPPPRVQRPSRARPGMTGLHPRASRWPGGGRPSACRRRSPTARQATPPGDGPAGTQGPTPGAAARRGEARAEGGRRPAVRPAKARQRPSAAWTWSGRAAVARLLRGVGGGRPAEEGPPPALGRQGPGRPCAPAARPRLRRPPRASR